jgi:hypothetical protein
MAQGMSEYVKPLMELAEEIEIEDLNAVLQVGMATWNYVLAGERGDSSNTRDKIVDELRTVFRLELHESVDLFEKMVERKRFLFPEDIQPPYPMVMFIRKETAHLINAFNYDGLRLSDDVVPPSSEDRELVRAIERLDRFIEEEADYSDYESLLADLQDDCEERFAQWLSARGLGEQSMRFTSCLEPYLDFVYAYTHDDIVTLKNISAGYIEEFLSDYLLRKVSVEPHEYVEWPPALKLFYEFLGENYYTEPSGVIDLVAALEPEFVETLRRHYG